MSSPSNTQIIKSLYFPPERTLNGKSARISFSVSQERNFTDDEFKNWLSTASSREIRDAINNPVLEDLQKKADSEGRTLSNYIVHCLVKKYVEAQGANKAQLKLPLNNKENSQSLGITFKDSKKSPIHRWYPYVEGFSAKYVRDVLANYRFKNVYDPFGGAGTAQLTASLLGAKSYFSEINPFMAFIAETKVNSVKWIRENWDIFSELHTTLIEKLHHPSFKKLAANIDLSAYHKAFPERDFFEEEHLRDLLAAKKIAFEISKDFGHIDAVFLAAIASVVVDSSNMTRRADLRRRRDDEYKNRVVNVPAYIATKLENIKLDILSIDKNIVMEETELVSEDVRQLPDSYTNFFDIAITSPPYLNGTNYFRNTKLEMWFTGYLNGEEDLSSFTEKGITAGINNVRLNRTGELFDEVERIVDDLTVVSPDKRIPLLVRQYFSDMFVAFKQIHKCLKSDGRFILDIGDSKFYGVHVPTDKLLCTVAEIAGFEVEAVNHLAKRYSKDKTPLVQVDIIFHKPA